MIKHAAVLWKNIIYPGQMHAMCMSLMRALEIPKEEIGQAMLTGCGFVTDEGKFVDRREAYKIAVENNQIVFKHGVHGILYSEDLLPLDREPKDRTVI